jgi:arginase
VFTQNDIRKPDNNLLATITDNMLHKGNIVVFDAPSNLGLRPPKDGVVPGCYKSPWALRDRNLLGLIGADDGGSLVPPRYSSIWMPGEGDRNAEAIATFSIDLANRLNEAVDSQRQILVLGGDCSILIGNMLGLKRRSRYGLVFFDAHSDFRHPGNSPHINAAAGEDLAIVTGRGDKRLIRLEKLGPYVLDEDVHIVGVRQSDICLDELKATEIRVTTSQQMKNLSPAQLVSDILKTVTRFTEGFWIHLDLDVIDASEMPAVDSPEKDGPTFKAISGLLSKLLCSIYCLGLEVTIYDPDLDPKGVYADRIVECLSAAFNCSGPQ